ncbi:hypothetical protein BD324DRAFT_653468 [Kockovaella imperatae]|uniref:DUF6534 domain-containing protein n=1 Tax=Kockovaella imperatae TaxID=4999 RepID=A0A1Y1U9L5_9TREE|nr:hypothetical protein BD324DRAFT_653468 [Kockovaella imperatae]ORX34196.1 hypothetical protein BD324DRAFT_653468 [Kockovaella imperatae]
MSVTPDAEIIAQAMITPNLGLYLGPHLLGLVSNAFWTGVIICQVTHWLPQARYDSLGVRLLVGTAVCATCVTAVFTVAMYMQDFVYHFGEFFQFMTFKLLGVYGLIQPITTVSVQLLFVERAIKVNGNSFVVAVISYILAAGTLAGGFAVFILSRGVTMHEVPIHLEIMFDYWPTACLVAHLFNTFCIIYGLHKARTGSERSDKLLKKLIRGCLEAQIPGTTYALLATIIICRDTSSPLIPYIVVTHAQVYLVGAMAMVNARHTWRRDGVTPQSFAAWQSETGLTTTPPHLTESGPTASESQVSSNRWPSTPPWGLDVEMGLTEDVDAKKREEDTQGAQEKRATLRHLSFMGRGNV